MEGTGYLLVENMGVSGLFIVVGVLIMWFVSRYRCIGTTHDRCPYSNP